MHFDLIAYGIQNRRQSADRADGPVQLSTPMVADDNRVCPHLKRHLGILGIQNTLEDYLAAPLLFQFGDFSPIKRRVELFGRPGTKIGGVVDAVHMAHDIAETAAFGTQHANSPTPFGAKVGDCFSGHFGRSGKTVF